MSTILKALSRIEKDRDSHPQPEPLRSDVPLAPTSRPMGPPSFASRSGARPGVWVVSAAALLVVSVGSWRLLAGSDSPATVAEPELQAVAIPEAVEQPPPESVRFAAASQAQATSPSGELPRVESPAAPEPLPPRAAATGPEALPREEAAGATTLAPIRSKRLLEIARHQPSDRGPQLLIEPEPGEALGGALQARTLIADGPITAPEPPTKAMTGEWVVPSPDPPAPKPLQQPAATRAEAVESIPDLPAVASAPPVVRVARQNTPPVVIPPPPAVRVLETAWHPIAERRSAQVSVQGFGDRLELQEGDAVGTLVVVSIHPTSVVFLHGGHEIKRRVGEN